MLLRRPRHSRRRGRRSSMGSRGWGPGPGRSGGIAPRLTATTTTKMGTLAPRWASVALEPSPS
eukprot:scaffold960_cov239-Prasinococcus_capsulatus_cf.AAC.1